MSDNPETLAAILAEMRKAVVPMICGRPKIESVTIRDVLQWADRIEAAAERERDEDRQLAAIAESDEAFARCARCDRPERSCNAAAMRAALEMCNELFRCDDDNKARLCHLARKADEAAQAALAAPARNCDICRTKREAKMEYDSRHNAEYGSRDDFIDWIFRPAEGESK